MVVRPLWLLSPRRYTAPVPCFTKLADVPDTMPDSTLVPVLSRISVRPVAKLMLCALLMSAPRNNTSPVKALVVPMALPSVMLPP